VPALESQLRQFIIGQVPHDPDRLNADAVASAI
jgi:hypothetical protein